jgi:hypothetical protein
MFPAVLLCQHVCDNGCQLQRSLSCRRTVCDVRRALLCWQQQVAVDCSSRCRMLAERYCAGSSRLLWYVAEGPLVWHAPCKLGGYETVSPMVQHYMPAKQTALMGQRLTAAAEVGLRKLTFIRQTNSW